MTAGMKEGRREGGRKDEREGAEESEGERSRYVLYKIITKLFIT